MFPLFCYEVVCVSAVMRSGRYSWCPYALSTPRGNTPSVYLASEKKKIERVETAPPSGQGCQNPVEDDGELHPHTLGVSHRGKALINIKANQILKHESLGPMAVYQCCVHL